MAFPLMNDFAHEIYGCKLINIVFYMVFIIFICCWYLKSYKIYLNNNEYKFGNARQL